MSIITLKDLKFKAYHGVYENEKLEGNTFLVDIHIELDTTKSEFTDQLEDTLDYVEVYNRIKTEMEKPSNLLENVVHRINNSIETMIDEGKIETTIYKQNPPIGGECSYTSVTLTTEI